MESANFGHHYTSKKNTTSNTYDDHTKTVTGHRQCKKIRNGLKLLKTKTSGVRCGVYAVRQ